MRARILLFTFVLASRAWAAPPKLVEQGYRAFYLHQWKKALHLAERAHGENPRNLDAFWLEALCHLHDRQPRLARKAAESALAVADSPDARAYANYLLAESWMGEDVARADRLIELKVIASGEPVGYSSAAWYYVKRGKGARALELIDKALPLMDEDHRPSALDTRGAALILLRRYEEAWKDLEKAIKAYRSANLLFHRAQCLEGRGRPGEALRLYRQSLTQGGWHEFEDLARQRVKALEKK